VTEAVLDASVVLKWFRGEGERHLASARSLRAEFEAGGLAVLAPPSLRLEMVNVAARRWGWGEEALEALAAALEQLGFEFAEPELSRIARWAGRGLTAYDAAYVALAEAEAIRLITDDDLIVATAPAVATALADVTKNPG